MTDYTLEDTIYQKFTTRAFATGIPTTLSGTPVVSAYENDNTTEITAGITLIDDFDSRTGLNHLTIAATAANGFEAGKDYNLVITTGTVGGVSVVGEVVGTFSIERSAAVTDIAALNNFDPATDTVANVTTVATTTTNDDMRGTDGANTVVPDAAGVAPTAVENRQEMDTNSTDLNSLLSGQTTINDNVLLIPTTAMRGTDGANTVAPDNASISAILADTNDMQPKLGTPAGASMSADTAAVKADTAAVKTKTDSLTFTKTNEVDSNIQSVNDVTVNGTGSPGTEWGP